MRRAAALKSSRHLAQRQRHGIRLCLGVLPADKDDHGYSCVGPRRSVSACASWSEGGESGSGRERVEEEKGRDRERNLLDLDKEIESLKERNATLMQQFRSKSKQRETDERNERADNISKGEATASGGRGHSNSFTTTTSRNPSDGDRGRVDERASTSARGESVADVFQSMDVIYVSAEVSPWSKTGGLGDVANSLPVALARLGHRVTVVSPLYTFVKDKFCIDEANSSSAKQAETDKNDHKEEEFHLRLRCVCEGIKLHMAESGIQHVKFWGTRWRKVDWIFVDHPCYMREGGPYGDGQEAFVDNAFRFSLLSLAAVELPLQWWSQVERRDTRDDAILFIANDWHASMVPVYLACKFRSNRVLENCRSLFTIHNLMHQGVQHPSLYSMLGLGNEHYHWFDYPTNNLVFDTPTLAASQQQGWLEMDNAASANANASPSLVPSSSLMDSDYDTNTYGSNNSGNGPGGGGGNVGVLDMMLQEDTLDAYQTSGEACINMLVGALRTCDRVVTVSSTYAWEICEKNSFGFGFGLQRELLKRRDDIYGITNGIDTEEWDPETDPHIHPHNYGKDNLLGKLRCKQSLARELYLDDDIGIPMIGFVGRLDKQKGADVLLDALPKILNNNSSSKVHVVLLGSGDEHLETRIRNAQKSFPNHFRGILEFNVALSHQIIAACDMLVMPSRFEPCGLNQLFSLRYGTIPIVHRVGGLSDTVEDFNPVGNKLRGSGTGWSFKPCNANKLTESVMLALSVMKGNREREGKLRGNLVAFPPSDHSSHHSNNSGDDEAGAAASTQVYSKSWLRLMQRCMNCEHSWPLAAYQYQMLMRWTMHSQSHLKEPHTLSKT